MMPHRLPSSRLPITLLTSALLPAISLALPACGDGGSGVGVPALQLTTSTTGFDLDPDGYQVSMDGGAPQAIGANDVLVIGDAAAGQHSVQLAGMAPNCQVQGANPRQVTVTDGSTATLGFSVLCSRAAAAGRVVVSTSAATPATDPDGYGIEVDGSQLATIGVAATDTLDGFAAGTHTVGLSGLADGCTVGGDNPQTVTVTAGGTTQVAFVVSCAGGGNPAPGPIRWTPVAKPNTATLNDLWASGPTDFIAAGTDKDRTTGVIVRFNGSAWTEELRRADVALQSVWGTGAGDVLAVGSRSDRPAAAILHYDGTAWADFPAPDLAQAGDTLVLLRGIWGTSPNDVYVVGAAYGGVTPRAIAAHYDGQRWTPLALPATAGRELLDVWGTSPTDVWVVGDVTGLPTGRDRGIILHFDGSAWTESVHGDDIHLKAAWGTGPNDVFTVGDHGTVLHWDGTAWTPQPTSVTKAVHEVWGTSPADVTAVCARGIILHYDGSAWSAITDVTVRDLFGVWGSGPADRWAVGASGVILHGTP